MIRPLSVLILVAAAGAAAAAAPPAETFRDETLVTAVEVPVQVVAHGQPVRGLGPENFELFDDGELLPLSSFEVIELAGAAGGTPPPLAARRHFLLLFDLTFSDPASVTRARAAGRALVAEALHPSDLVAVAAYTASRGAELLLGFTPDRAQVLAMLDRLGPSEPLRHYRDPLGLVTLDAFDPGHPYRGGGGAGNNKAQRYDIMQNNYRDLEAFARRSERDRREADVLSLTSSLEELAALLAAAPGRKHVVLLSEGFDSSVVIGTEDAQRLEQMAEQSMRGEIWRVDAEERFGSAVAQRALARALEAFRRADSVVEAVDIGGVRADQDVAARADGRGQNGLYILAHETGGELYRNYNDLGAAMGEVLERTSVTYLLTVEPSVAADGRFHRLQVKLRGAPDGARAVHRPGYYAPRPYAELGEEERRLSAAGLVVGGADGGPLPVDVLAAPFALAAGGAYVPVVLDVDGPALLAMAGDAAGAAVVEVYGYAIARGGAVRDFFADTLTVDLAASGATLAAGGLKYWGHLALPPDDYLLRLVLRDGRTGAATVRSVPLRVPDTGAGRPVLLPPFVPEAAEARPLAAAAPAPAGVEFPFVLAGEPFLPAARPRLESGRSTAVSLVGYGLGEGPLAVTAVLLDAAGSRVAEPRLAVRDGGTPAGGRLEADLACPGVAPGDYQLVVAVTDARGVRVTASPLPVTVRG